MSAYRVRLPYLQHGTVLTTFPLILQTIIIDDVYWKGGEQSIGVLWPVLIFPCCWGYEAELACMTDYTPRWYRWYTDKWMVNHYRWRQSEHYFFTSRLLPFQTIDQNVKSCKYHVNIKSCKQFRSRRIWNTLQSSRRRSIMWLQLVPRSIISVLVTVV